MLTQLIVPKGFSVRGSGDDLSNYFYLLKHNADWLPRNAVGTSFDGEGYEAYGGEKGQKYLLAFRVVAMGDLNAVDISQQVHLEVLQDAHCMQDGERIEFRQPLPASHTWEGLYIDDHIVTQILPAKKLRKSSDTYRDNHIIASSRQQYAAQGIPRSEKKAFQKADRFVAWGTEVDNKTGRVGTPLVKLKHLHDVLVSVCRLPRVSKKMLQAVTGLLVHPFTHRRSLMCLLQDTFVHIEKLRDDTPQKLPVSVKEELLMFALTLPLCHTCCRWPISERIGASDASSTGGGRAAVLVNSPIAETLFRFAEHKGEYVRMDWEKASLQPSSSMTAAPEELEELLGDFYWNQTEACSFAHAQHINILETRMIYRELRDIVHSSTKGLRCVLLVDSRAAVGAWSKGRSSARNLNRIIRRGLGWCLAGRKTLHLVWIRSKATPSDFPSRGRRIPEPDREPCTLTKKVLGEDLHVIRNRVPNREIWRRVNSAESNPGAEDHAYRVGFVGIPDCKMTPQPVPVGRQENKHPALEYWSFREIFSGVGHLTSEFRKDGSLVVLPPFDIIQRVKDGETQNILDNFCFEALCIAASKPRQLWHLGFPCGSFSILQNLNKGTRSTDRPLGNDTLARERQGNEILFRTITICHLLSSHGSFFTLENPKSSFAWIIPQMINLKDTVGCIDVDLDQCAYGLKIPNDQGDLGFAKKATRFLGTLPRLMELHRCCPGNHSHVPVIGCARFKGKWRKRSELAGAYPKKLCQAYNKIFLKSFA